MKLTICRSAHQEIGVVLVWLGRVYKCRAEWASFFRHYTGMQNDISLYQSGDCWAKDRILLAVCSAFVMYSNYCKKKGNTWYLSIILFFICSTLAIIHKSLQEYGNFISSGSQSGTVMSASVGVYRCLADLLLMSHLIWSWNWIISSFHKIQLFQQSESVYKIDIMSGYLAIIEVEIGTCPMYDYLHPIFPSAPPSKRPRPQVHPCPP
jgi:hypothetical protein